MKQLLATIIVFLALAKLSAQHISFGRALLPDEIILQYAGNSGWLSAGFGYETKNQKFSGAVLYGFVPGEISKQVIHSITGKIAWHPLRRRIARLDAELIYTGLFLNYAFGKQYFAFDPPFYPYEYYDFPTAINTAIFFGQSVGFHQWKLYYELGSTGKELITYFGNTKSVKITDVLTAGVGVKYQLRWK